MPDDTHDATRAATKVVLLAGGYGTRLAEHTDETPKPMVEIGGRPILWHIMKIYGHYGFDDFIVACGYKGEVIKRFFLDYRQQMSDLVIDYASGRVDRLSEVADPWRIALLDTGPFYLGVHYLSRYLEIDPKLEHARDREAVGG